MNTKDLASITTVALGTAALTVATFLGNTIEAGNDANPDSLIALTFYFERQVLLLQRDLAEAVQSSGRSTNIDALRHRRPLFQGAREVFIVPERRKMDLHIAIGVGVNEARQGRERQFRPVHRMREQKRITGRRFNRPKII